MCAHIGRPIPIISEGGLVCTARRSLIPDISEAGMFLRVHRKVDTKY